MATALEIFIRSRLDAQGINEAILKTRALQSQMAASGQSFDNVKIRFQETSNAANQFAKTTEQGGDILERFMRGPLNKLGFTLFITSNTIRSITGLFKGFFDTLQEGAQIIDRSEAFNRLLTGEGIDPNRIRKNLDEATQGVVKMDLAFSKTIQLLKAGFPEMAAQSDEILRIATNSAILSGELDKVDVIFEKLIKGIIRGSPRLIDDADLILKLGDSNERYAASLGKTVEELTAAEKVQATFNAVLQEGQRINKLADSIDSTALKFQRFRVDVQETGDIIKQSLTLASVETAEQLGEITRSGFNVIGALTALGGASEETQQLTNLLFKDLSTSAATVAALFAGGFATIRDVLAQVFEPLNILVDQAIVGIEAFTLFWDAVHGELTAAEIVDALKQIGEAQKDVALEAAEFALRVALTGDAVIDLTAAMEAGFPAYLETLQLFGVIPTVVDEATLAMNKFAGVLEGLAGIPLDAVTNIVDQMIEGLKAPDFDIQFAEKAQDSMRDHSRKMAKIREDLTDKLADIEEKEAARIEQLREKRNLRLERIEEDWADRIDDINQDLVDKQSDIAEDADARREDAHRDSAKKKEKIEEDHQRRINDILRRFELSRLKAIIDRDARALFEAEQRRDQDLASLVEDTEAKRKEEQDRLQERLNDIQRMEERRRRDAEKAAERRRRDARQAADRQREDAKKDFERQRKDAKANAEKQRKDARAAEKKRREDALKDQAERLIDLRRWYDDQLEEQRRKNTIQRLEEFQQFNGLQTLTSLMLNRMLILWSQFLASRNTLISANPPPSVAPGGDGGAPPPSDGDAPPPGDGGGEEICTIPRIACRCNASSTQGTKGPDGRWYLCVNGRWALVSDIFDIGSTTTSETMTTTSGTPRSGGTVNINVTGDETLEQIFKEIAYEATIEVMQT